MLCAYISWQNLRTIDGQSMILMVVVVLNQLLVMMLAFLRWKTTLVVDEVVASKPLVLKVALC